MLEAYDNFLNIDSTVTDISKGINESNIESAITNNAISYSQTTLNTLSGSEAFKSTNFVTGQSGWKIDGYGNVEFNNGVFRGQLIAGQIHIPSLTAMESFHVDSSGNAWWGHNAYANAPAYILSDGTAKFTLGLIGGTIIGSDYIKSNNYDSGVVGKGWKLDSDGNADFQNIKVRGKISSSVFEKDTVSAIGGSLLLTPSDSLAADMDSDDVVLTTTNTVFAVGTILRIKDETYDEWLKVTEVDSNNHTVTRDISNNYPGVKPSWKTGVAVVSMGNTGDGFIEMDTSGTNTPFIKLSKRESDTYNDVDTKVIIGNLKDKTGVEEYGLWVKGESVYIGGYKTYDAIASKNGSDTEVYYAGQVFASIKACIDYAETQSEDKIIIFVKNGTYSELQNCSSTNLPYQDGWDIDVILIGEDKNNTLIYFDSSNWGWKFDRKLTLTNIEIRADGSFIYGPLMFYPSSASYNYLDISNSIIKKVSTVYTANQVAFYINSGDYAGSVSIRTSDISLVSSNGLQNMLVLYIYGTKDTAINITNCNIYSDRGGIYISSNYVLGSGYINIENNKIDSRFGDALYVTTSSNQIKINNNSITNGSAVTLSGSYGIRFKNYSSSKNNVISNNYVAYFDYGIYDESENGSYNYNNIVKSCSSFGIFAEGTYAGTLATRLVYGNLIISCGASTTTTGGIGLAYANVSIKNNIIYSCYCGIIDTDNPVNKITINDNYVYGSHYGFRLMGSSGATIQQNIVVLNNFLYGDGDSDATGIMLPYGNNFIISNNIVDNFPSTALRFLSRRPEIQQLSNTVIDSNIFGVYNASNEAITFSDTHTYEVTITGNLCGGNVRLNAFGYSRFIGNKVNGLLEFNATGYQSLIDSNYIYASNNVGIVLYSEAQQLSITNNRIVSTYRAISVYGACYILRISNNSIYSDNGEGMAFWSGSNESVVISDNYVESGGDNGIIVFYGNLGYTTSINAYMSTITGNVLKKSLSSEMNNGIHITGSANNVIISNNGIWCGNGSNTRYGVRVNGTATYCIFSSNRIANGVPAGTQDGIYLGSNSGSIFNSNLRT